MFDKHLFSSAMVGLGSAYLEIKSILNSPSNLNTNHKLANSLIVLFTKTYE
jgi:hypothetical protein